MPIYLLVDTRRFTEPQVAANGSSFDSLGTTQVTFIIDITHFRTCERVPAFSIKGWVCYGHGVQVSCWHDAVFRYSITTN